jgi:hypothetical protein
MLRQPGFRIFMAVALLLALIALLGPRFGLIGCDTVPVLSIGPCQVGETRPQ